MEEIKKRAKIERDQIYESKNYSFVLTKPFLQINDMIEVFFYRFANAKKFGLMLSIAFLPCPDILEFVGIRHISNDKYENLKKFQNVFWSDLFQMRLDPEEVDGEDRKISEACYLVVPLKTWSINWNSIKIALNQIPMRNILLVSQANRHKYIVKTKDSPTTYYYINRLTAFSKFKKVIESLPQKSLYSQKVPDEIQAEIKERTLELLNEVKNIRGKSHNSLALLRRTKMVRRNPVPSTKGKLKPGSLVLVPEDTLFVHYLSRSHFRQGISLTKSLIEVERYSYLIDFCSKFPYKGDFLTLRNATTAPIYDNFQNYDSLENLGDSVLKVISSLWAYFKYPSSSEGFLTDIRTSNIKNTTLSSICKAKELFNYLRGFKLKNKAFRPAFYRNKPQVFECSVVQDKFSEGTLADLVESLTGAFYRTGGFESAAEFLKKISIFDPKDWKNFEFFFKSNYIALYTTADLNTQNFENFSQILKKPETLTIKPNSDYKELEKALNYTFKHKELLKQALTHSSLSNKKNYERLEFLGDAVIDIIVNSNTFNLGHFTADKLTIFRHMLVNNNLLSKLSLSLNLQNYLKSTSEAMQEIQRYLSTLQWEENILDFGFYNSDPPKILNDLFEALAGAVLIDSENLDLTCRIFAPLMKNLIVHLVQNKEKCDQNVMSRVSVCGQRTRRKVVVKTGVVGNEVKAEIWAGSERIGEYTARTSWLAKQTAAKEALTWFQSKYGNIV